MNYSLIADENIKLATRRTSKENPNGVKCNVLMQSIAFMEWFVLNVYQSTNYSMKLYPKKRVYQKGLSSHYTCIYLCFQFTPLCLRSANENIIRRLIFKFIYTVVVHSLTGRAVCPKRCYRGFCPGYSDMPTVWHSELNKLLCDKQRCTNDFVTCAHVKAQLGLTIGKWAVIWRCH